MIKAITKNIPKDCIEVTLEDGTILQFSVHYSGYEDCINLVLLTGGNHNSMTVMKDVFVGPTDEAYEFLETIKDKW